MRGGCLSLCGMALRPLELLVGAALRLRPVVLTTMTHIMHVSPCLRVTSDWIKRRVTKGVLRQTGLSHVLFGEK